MLESRKSPFRSRSSLSSSDELFGLLRMLQFFVTSTIVALSAAFIFETSANVSIIAGAFSGALLTICIWIFDASVTSWTLWFLVMSYGVAAGAITAGTPRDVGVMLGVLGGLTIVLFLEIVPTWTG